MTRPLARAFSAWPKVPVTGAGPRGVHEVGSSATGAAGRRRASENSEVLPAESVAVALSQSPVLVAAVRVTEKRALPVASVLTVAEPR